MISPVDYEDRFNQTAQAHIDLAQIEPPQTGATL
jgi:hypothetical protein